MKRAILGLNMDAPANMFDYAVVGSGIGGSSMAALLSAQGFNVILLEKEPYLGGCSSTFSHKGYKYNTGATTLSGYEDGYIVKEIFESINFIPNVIKTDPSIVIIQNGKITPRYNSFEKFLEVLDSNYPHTKNREFWLLIHKLNQKFYTKKGHYYSNSNIFSKVNSLLSFIPLFLEFHRYLNMDAESFIKQYFGAINEEYMQFLESQILIVAQAPAKKINFLTAALSLGYTFNQNYYAVGGLGAVFDGLTKNIKDVHKNSEIIKIKQFASHFELYTKDRVFEAKKVILNSTVYDSGKLFENKTIQNYYKKYEKLNNHQSSFMLYMTLKSDKKFEHHYQIIKDEVFSHTISKALFVSFSDAKDNTITPDGYYSVTASIHTDLRFWTEKATSQVQKKELLDILLNTILDTLKIEKNEVVNVFGATPNTFQRYINRSQLGGNAITMKNFLPFLPSNNTPIDGLYHLGDSVYAAQGWPGVMLGVKNLKHLLDV